MQDLFCINYFFYGFSTTNFRYFLWFLWFLRCFLFWSSASDCLNEKKEVRAKRRGVVLREGFITKSLCCTHQKWSESDRFGGVTQTTEAVWVTPPSRLRACNFVLSVGVSAEATEHRPHPTPFPCTRRWHRKSIPSSTKRGAGKGHFEVQSLFSLQKYQFFVQNIAWIIKNA